MFTYKYTDPHPLADHPIFRKGTVGLISGENPLFPPLNTGGHNGLKARLNEMGLKYQETQGKYGKPENSFIVINPHKQQLYQLGKELGQESVIYGENGQHQLLYTNGPNDGHFHPSQDKFNYDVKAPKDLYTVVPSKGFFSIHFAWDKLHPSEFAKPQF